ncbi:MAG: ArnT family glycosyltransferase [Terriglobales bacterium]
MSKGAAAFTIDQQAPTTARQLAPAQRWRVHAIFLLAFAFCAAYAYMHLETGWVCSDDGSLAQTAYRVLKGQLPHRDFSEIYTGGLGYIHATGYRLFGVNLVALRMTLFVFFLGWLPSVFYIASRLASPLAAAGVMVLAAVWTIPTYPAAMPSWYNLFFAMFGIAALLRYLDVGTQRWLFLAGICGGISFLIKIIGLYYVAGVLLFLLFREQHLSTGNDTRQHRSPFLYRVFMTVGLSVFTAVLVFMIHKRPDEAYFLVPAVALAAVLLLRERRTQPVGSKTRFRNFFHMAGPFGAGITVPVTLFLLPYYMSGSLRSFWEGVVSAGVVRAQSMGLGHPFPTLFLLYALPLLALLTLATYGKGSPLSAQCFVAVFLAGYLLFAVKNYVATLVTFYAAQELIPAVVLFGTAILVMKPKFAERFSEKRQQQLMLIIAVASLCSLVQIPFSAPIYFCYCAPLTVLAILAVVSTRKMPGGPYVLAALLAFYIGFGILKIVPSEIYHTGIESPLDTNEPLRLSSSGGLKVAKPWIYEELISTVQQHSRSGLLLAGPNSPEVYFLSGLRNPTREDYGMPFPAAIHNESVNVIVVNESPFFGPRLSPAGAKELSIRFPNSRHIGDYWVLWRP